MVKNAYQNVQNKEALVTNVPLKNPFFNKSAVQRYQQKLYFQKMDQNVQMNVIIMIKITNGVTQGLVLQVICGTNALLIKDLYQTRPTSGPVEQGGLPVLVPVVLENSAEKKLKILQN